MRGLLSGLKALVLGVLLLGTACSPQGALAPESSAEILWDTWGVPHVYAESDEALFRAFGRAQMESHGELLLELYAQARGRAAEVRGEEGLESDRWVRTMGIYPRARQWYEDQTPGFRRILDAFAAGINDYADEPTAGLSERSRSVLPVSAVDVLAHAQRVVQFSFVGRPRAVGQAAQLVAGEGSSAWAIAPARSASGRSMLLINPHLAWAGEQLFYEVHLNGPGVGCYGVTLVGFPVVVIGFNDRLGWTHTVNTLDGADSYELALVDGGYLYDGEPRAFESEQQTLLVRRDDGTFREEPLTIRRSVQGPVIAEGNGKAVAYRVAGLDASGMLEQWWDMSRAADLEAFEAALSRLQVPVFNVLYADRDGHILYVFNGRVPKRPGGTYLDWLGAVSGDTSETLWTDYLSYHELPRVLDPPSGWLQNANDPPWTSTFPAALDPARYPPFLAPQFMHFRAQQSASLLAADQSISFEELVAYKHWTVMLLADRLVDDLVAAAREHGSATARAAAEVLAEWDRTADADSRGAVLFERWAERMELGRTAFLLDEDSRQLMRETFVKPWDPGAPFTTPAGLKDPERASAVLDAVAREIVDEYGTLSVAWGEVHRLRYGGWDLPANGGDGDPTGLFRTVWFGPSEAGVDTVVGGDAFYAAVEFSQPVRARVLLAYGNATREGSPHVGDQIESFARKEMRAPWLTRAEVEAHLESRETVRAR
jgi:acyl-homoserine-lactone acylase